MNKLDVRLNHLIDSVEFLPSESKIKISWKIKDKDNLDEATDLQEQIFDYCIFASPFPFLALAF